MDLPELNLKINIVPRDKFDFEKWREMKTAQLEELYPGQGAMMFGWSRAKECKYRAHLLEFFPDFLFLFQDMRREDEERVEPFGVRPKRLPSDPAKISTVYTTFEKKG
jgi:hypothetical protein